MFQIEARDVVTFIIALFGGGGVGWIFVQLYIKDVAKKALKDDLDKINKSYGELGKKFEDEKKAFSNSIKEVVQNSEKADTDLHQRINQVEQTYVTCKYCEMQHHNLETTLKSMDDKLDIIIKQGLGG